MSTAIRDRAISLLGNGFSHSIVANALGCSPSYISQLLEESAVSEEVANLRAANLESKVEADNKVDSLETKALDIIEQKMPFVRSAAEAANIFKTLNSAKRKGAINTPDSDAGTVMIVNIRLPRAALESIQVETNKQNQVIGIDGRSMAPLPSRALNSLRASQEAATTVEVKTLSQTATSERLAAADAERATELLDNINKIGTKRVVALVNGKELEL